MRKVTTVVVLLLATGVAGWLTHGLWQNYKRNAAFTQTRVGDKEQDVISRFGAPDHRESSDKPYSLYTGVACTPPCQTRLWWEDSLLPGISAWSVELGTDRRVVKTTRWSSP